MEIANIVSEDKINIGPEFNVVNSLDEIIFKELPTLIIGYDNICRIYGKENILVLKRNINRTIFWTFKRNEKRNLYNEDVEDFIIYSYKKYIEKINYVDVDVIQFTPFKLRKIVRKMLELKNIISYKTSNNIIYIFGNDLIFGVDLNSLNYIGLDIVKIENKIIAKSNIFLSGEDILIEYQANLNRLNNDLKYLPVLYSIKPYQ